MKVSAIIKGRTDENGHRPIQVRITKGKQRSYKPTHIRIDPELFEKGRVKPKHPKHKEYNEKLSMLILQYQAQTLNPEKKVVKIHLFDYISQCINQWDRVRKDSTIRVYVSQLEKLKAFTPNILLSHVDQNFLYSYQSFLVKLGNAKNTVWSAFKFLRTILNKAVQDDLIDKSPFKKFTMPRYEETVKNYLSDKEINKIDKFCQDKKCPKELVFVGTWFLIACTTGLRLADLRAFDRKANIHSGRLVVKTSKTGDIIGLPITPKLKSYFERIKYQPLNMTGENYNRLLKLIAMGAGIDKKISSHSARHSFSMALANNGVSQEVAAKLLGHADMRSTRTYYKISNIRIDNELKKLK
jgi:integrase/recombinase XerD